ncbi:fucolectin-4-like [Mytilus trossulus]|uniref:fucolectin-4-like n=1 Tax=Mytilus trossulus TaxID=6551 RepID=UPI0030051C3A
MQSSTLVENANRPAISSLANDGSNEQNYMARGGPFCSHTLADEANYWWALDLGQEYNIITLTIYNRRDCCGNRFADFFIYIYNPQINTWTNFDDEQGQLCFFHNGAAPAVLNIACNRIIRGRFVKIFKEYKYSYNTDALTLCEVEIFADHTPDEGIFCKQKNKQAMVSLQQNLENATPIRCALYCRDSDNCLGFQMANGGRCSLFQTSMQVDGISDDYYERC